MELNLKKFSPKTCGYGKTVLFIGRRGSGKSYLMRDYLYHKRDIPIACIISPTEESNCFFGTFAPKLFIYHDYSPELIGNFVKRQKAITKKMRREESDYGQSEIDPRGALVLDDCLYQKNWYRNPHIRFLFLNGRHTHSDVFVTLQDSKDGVPPILRSNADIVFIMRENLYNNRKRLYEAFCGMFPTFAIFCTVLDQCTVNNGCLVIINSCTSNKIEDQVFWYRAEPHDNFKIGSPEVWEYSRKFHKEDENNEDDSDLMDLNEYTKKGSVTLKVNKT